MKKTMLLTLKCGGDLKVHIAVGLSMSGSIYRSLC